MSTAEAAAADAGRALYAEVGDTLVIDQPDGAGLPRVGEIVAIPGPRGAPPYLVRWLAGDYESLIVPGRMAHVERRHHVQRA